MKQNRQRQRPKGARRRPSRLSAESPDPQATPDINNGNPALRFLSTVLHTAHFDWPQKKAQRVPLPQALKAAEIYLRVDTTSDTERTLLEILHEIRQQELTRATAVK